ncbi:hypothetical protein ACXZ9C_11285 [Streptococcus agalactiae]
MALVAWRSRRVASRWSLSVGVGGVGTSWRRGGERGVAGRWRRRRRVVAWRRRQRGVVVVAWLSVARVVAWLVASSRRGVVACRGVVAWRGVAWRRRRRGVGRCVGVDVAW